MGTDADGNLGTRLARLREERDMTQQALAAAAGVTRAQIAALENGRTANPGIHTLVPLADALRVSLDEIVGRQRDRTGPDLIAALGLLTERTEKLGYEPYDWFTPATFADWSMGTALTYDECVAAIGFVNEMAIPAPKDSRASEAAAYFVTGAVAGAMLERWRR